MRLAGFANLRPSRARPHRWRRGGNSLRHSRETECDHVAGCRRRSRNPI